MEKKLKIPKKIEEYIRKGIAIDIEGMRNFIEKLGNKFLPSLLLLGAFILGKVDERTYGKWYNWIIFIVGFTLLILFQEIIIGKRNVCAKCGKKMDIKDYHIQLCKSCRETELDKYTKETLKNG